MANSWHPLLASTLDCWSLPSRRPPFSPLEGQAAGGLLSNDSLRHADTHTTFVGLAFLEKKKKSRSKWFPKEDQRKNADFDQMKQPIKVPVLTAYPTQLPDPVADRMFHFNERFYAKLEMCKITLFCDSKGYGHRLYSRAGYRPRG